MRLLLVRSRAHKAGKGSTPRGKRVSNAIKLSVSWNTQDRVDCIIARFYIPQEATWKEQQSPQRVHLRGLLVVADLLHNTGGTLA